MHQKRIRHLAAALMLCICATLHAQISQSFYADSSGNSMSVTFSVTAVSGTIVGQPANTRDVTWRFQATGRKVRADLGVPNGTGQMNHGGGQVVAYALSGTKVVTGVTRCSLATEAVTLRLFGTFKAQITGGTVEPNCTFYADSNYEVKIQIAPNNKDVPVEYVLMQGSTRIGSVTLQPGQGLIQTFYTTNPAAVTVVENVPQYGFDGGAWVVLDGAVTSTTVGTSTPVVAPHTGSPTSISPTGAGTGAPGPGQGAPAANETIWKQPVQGSPALTGAEYKEGVDKILAKLGTTTGGTISMTGVETRIDTTNTRLNDIKTKQDEAKSLLQDMKDALTAEETVTEVEFDSETDATTAINAAQALGVLSKLPSVPTITGPGAHSGHFSLPMTIGLTGFPSTTIDVDLTQWDTQINLFKTIVRAALVLAFFFMSLKALKEAFA